jgi:hypothetical protein
MYVYTCNLEYSCWNKEQNICCQNLSRLVQDTTENTVIPVIQEVGIGRKAVPGQLR